VRRLPTVAVPAVAALLGLPTVVAPGTTVAQVTYTVAFCLIVGVAWLGVRSHAGPATGAHALMAAALTVWLAGDLLYDVLHWWLGGLGTVSAADVLWISGYPLLAAALIKMTRLRAPGRLREGLLDGLAMATVAAALFVQFMILPAVADGLTLEGLIGAFYPFGDVLLFATAAILVLAPGDRYGPTRYLVAALTLTFLGDVGISVLASVFPDFDAGRLDGLLLLANSLLAAALWHPHADRLTRSHAADDERLHPARVVFLGVALLALPALAGLRMSGAVIDRVTLMAAMMAVTVIVLIRFTLVVRDQERVRRDLAHRATHDQLTGLVNRQELHARLSGALERRTAGSAGPVVHFLDLDDFKVINDVYGHAAGDLVLAGIAERLRAEVRRDDTVARLGGDEFVVLTEGDPAEGDPAEGDDEPLAERLRRAVTVPLRYLGHDLTVGVSIGTASAAGREAPTADELLAAADAIMYREKTADQLAPYREVSVHPLA
jgi:diguanylate cyclase (GGDEF)-like protein